MAAKPKLLTIKLADIDVADRVQPLDEAKAQEIATSFLSHHQLINRIGLRQTPNGASGWVLIHGRHRLRALEIAGVAELVEGTHFERLNIEPAQARLMEIEENMARTDVSPFGRAVMLVAYRAAIGLDVGRGGDHRSVEFQSATNGALKIEDRRSDEMKGRTHAASEALAAGFADHAMSVFDLSDRQVDRLLQIGTKLTAPVGLADRLYFSKIARNQAQLLKLAALAPENLARAAEAFDAVEGDFHHLMAILEAAPARQAALLRRLKAGAPLEEIVEDTKLPSRPPAEDYYDRAISSFDRLPRDKRQAAAKEFFKKDPRAVRAALREYGYDLVKIDVEAEQ